jgi:phosphoglycerate dehydrogenase-like enzyme
MTNGADPLVVGVPHPPDLDVGALEDLTSSEERPLDIRIVEYADPARMRQEKAAGTAADELRSGEPSLGPARRDDLESAEVLLALDAPLDLLQMAPRLRWVQSFGAGQLIRVLGQGDVALTSASGLAAPSIAEFVMARLLEVWKDIRTLEKMQRERSWEAHFGQKAAGRALAIIGLGSIGMEVARRAHAFDMRVIAVRRHPQRHQKPEFVDRISGSDGLHEVLAEADAVVLSAAATGETSGLMGEREYTAMRPGSILCNVARGSLIDEEALPAALRAGRPGAAILDVTRVEPLPEDSPLWSTPGVYLSPHSSTSMDGYNDRLLGLFADNLLRYQRGAPLQNLVDRARGY